MGSWEKEFRLVSGREIVAPEKHRKKKTTNSAYGFPPSFNFPFLFKK
jgi:hypothetical protein